MPGKDLGETSGSAWLKKFLGWWLPDDAAELYVSHDSSKEFTNEAQEAVLFVLRPDSLTRIAIEAQVDTFGMGKADTFNFHTAEMPLRNVASLRTSVGTFWGPDAEEPIVRGFRLAVQLREPLPEIPNPCEFPVADSDYGGNRNDQSERVRAFHTTLRGLGAWREA